MSKYWLIFIFFICATARAQKAQYAESSLIINLSTNTFVFAKHPNKTLSIASVTKLVPTAYLLEAWGAHARFKTKLYISGHHKNHSITGNLYIKGDGDPSITSEKIWNLALALKNLGLKKIAGDLIIDNTLFSTFHRVPNESQAAYNAPISAFSVNFNTIAVVIAPSKRANTTATVSLEPYNLDFIKIINTVKTVAHQKTHLKVLSTTNKKEIKLFVSGNINIMNPPKKIYHSIKNPVHTSGNIVLAAFKHFGITIRGKVRQGKISHNAKLLYVFKSEPLFYTLKALNMYSNNYIADMLVSRIGAPHTTLTSKHTALSAGSAILSNYLQAITGTSMPAHLKNGSGLTHHNQLSARQIVTLLTTVWHKQHLYPDFVATLASAGRTGTLEKRFQHTKTKHLIGYIRAKTGTLTTPTTVSALAGFAYGNNKTPYAFAIIQNGIPQRHQPMLKELQNYQDRLLAKYVSPITSPFFSNGTKQWISKKQH